MRRHLASALVALVFAALLPHAPTARAQTEPKTIVGPSVIYSMDAESVLVLATKEWQSASVRHQEKLLRHSLRLAYWRKHIPADMRRVFDELGYPTGRVLSQPIGHSEEAWYYGQLSPPIRFRDGVLVNADEFDRLRSRR
ncbi:MAG TPA: hypothetical protein VFU59_08445 [Candidatus Eisenbacteria bacterium]|nr:hypothetical protein [Candidatus Eisenbacteria bacterium]